MIPLRGNEVPLRFLLERDGKFVASGAYFGSGTVVVEDLEIDSAPLGIFPEDGIEEISAGGQRIHWIDETPALSMEEIDELTEEIEAEAS